MYRYLIGILVCIAIIFGIWYSSQKPTPSSQSTTWRITSPLLKPKGQNEFDVIVVGGGFGGLSAGALLAKNGYKVLLVDKNDEVGGLCSGYEKNGFHFDYGAEDIEGLWERGSIRYLLDQLSLQQTNFFVPNTRRLIVGDSFIDIGYSQNAMEDALAKKFPTEENAIHEFFAKAKKVYLEIYDREMIQEWGVVIPQELASEIMPKIWNDTYAVTHPNLLEWNQKTYQDVVDEYFTDMSLKRILCGLLDYFGEAPAWTAASKVVFSSFGYFFYGGYHALQTPQHFAKALSSYITQYNGQVLGKTYVDAILVNSTGVTGIRAGGKKYSASIVISNANAKVTYLDLIDRKFLDPKFRSNIEEPPLGDSAITLDLAVPSKLSQYPTLIQDKDNQTYLTISSQDDPALAPAGQSAVVLRTVARFDEFFGLSKNEQSELIRKRTESLLERGKTLIPELANATIVKVLTPMNYEQIANLPQGALSWIELPTHGKKAYFKGPIRGLYLSSASVKGAGVELVIGNGILCAQDIMGWKTALDPSVVQ